MGDMVSVPVELVDALREAASRFGPGGPVVASNDRGRWSEIVDAARAVLAAASGPWAEQLDTANTARDAYKDASEQHLRECMSLVAARDAALARNAELERDVRNVTDWAMTREKERDALRAELDNLRNRVNALADKWQDSEFRRKQPVLAYVGLDVAARDLTADRQAFDREVARKGAEVGRMNAAIVRGSDDEA